MCASKDVRGSYEVHCVEPTHSKYDYLASVIEFKTPGKFFIHIRTVEIMECLRKVTLALQKTYAKMNSSDEYLPAKGEVCAAKYSQDQNWYRGLVQTVDSSLKKVNILYIDFGNEEDVTLDRLQPLSKDIDPLWPSAVQCRVAQLVPVKGTWSEECCNSARQMLLGQTCQISIVETLHGEASFTVHVTVPKIGKQLDSYLIEQGYAAKEEDAKNSQAECDINTILNTALENYKSNVSERNEENNQTQVPEPITLCIDEAFVSVVTHVTSPDDFILQQLQNAKDNQWYRATVLSYTSKDKVCVGYIDFGNCEELNVCCNCDQTMHGVEPLGMSVPRKQLDSYLIEQGYAAKEEDAKNSQAECDINTILNTALENYKSNVSERNEENNQTQVPEPITLCIDEAFVSVVTRVKPILGVWTPEAILIMKKLVSSKFLKAKVVGRKERKALIELCDEHSDPQASIAELLIATGYAAAAAAEEEERKKHKADSAVKTEDTAPTVPLPEKLEWTSAGLPDSQAVDVAVSVLHSPGEFYCQRYITRDLQALNELSVELSRYCRAESNLFTPAVGEPCCAIFPDLQALNELSVELSRYCRAESNLFTPAVGEPCCAIFPGDGNWYRAMVKEVASNGKAKVYFVDYGNMCDGNWYRAMVKEVASNGKAKVYFVDYGNMCELAADQLRPIVAKYLKHPFQAIKCWLAGIKPLEKDWTKDAIARFQALTRGTQPKVQVVSKNKSGFGIDMRWKEQNIASILVAEELAVAENANIAETPAAAPPDTPHTGGSFPHRWKTAELPLNETFQLHIAEVVNPSLFFAMNIDSQGAEALKHFVIVLNCFRVTTHFRCDKNWYRAIVLETFDTTAKVIYADYGNSESVEYSSILPIQEKHLALPFQVVKCALAENNKETKRISAGIAKACFWSLMTVLMARFASMALAVSLRLICTALLFQVMQCSTAVDVLFLLDGSYSIGKGSFERSKHFAFKLCDALDINPERVRVGVIQYSSTPRLEFSLNSYPTKDEVKERIKKLSFKGGSTQTGQALKYILRKGFPGGRNTTVPRILIVLTDGKSQGTVQPASQLKEEGITIFAVGIKYPRWDELHTLASLPTEQHVLFAEHFNDAVNGLYTTLTSATVCTAVPSDPCDSQPCHNRGTCIPDGLEKYSCVCPVGFGGDPNCGTMLPKHLLRYLLHPQENLKEKWENLLY
ncbi:UNVERIFIED_CONTAM: hypothetical protein FKN15_051856 [Acipenser sinensis]